MHTPDRVLVEIVVAAPIDAVWRALRDPSQIRRWFGWDYAGLVDEVDLFFVTGVRADDAGYVLHFEGMPDRFALEAAGSHTIVRLIRAATTDDVSWQGIYDDLIEGWLTFVQQLRFVLERHPADQRRALFLNGRAQKPGDLLPAEALGLGAAVVVPIGQRYKVATAMGDVLEGTIWFRTVYQLGVTVDAYGDGLIIINTRPKTAKSAHGGGTVVITTYGLNDVVFAQLRERWTRWWTSQYEVIEVQPELT
jgi:hypothetical protein